MSSPLTLKAAAEIVGKSEATLRRLVKAGELVVEPRPVSNAPYLVTLEALEAAGLVPEHAYTAPTQSEPEAVSDRVAELEAEIERLRPFELEAAVNGEAVRRLEAQLGDLRELIAPALGELRRMSAKIEGLEAGLGVPTQAAYTLPTHEQAPEKAERPRRFALWRRS